MVEKVIDYICEGRLRWYGHCTRMKVNEPVKIVRIMEVEGRSRRRPKMKLIDAIRRNEREINIYLDDALDRVSWKRMIRRLTPNGK